MTANDMLHIQDPRLGTAHRLETVASTSPPDTEHAQSATPNRWATASSDKRSRQLPTAAVDVYVDDFLLLAQTRHQQQRVMRAALTGIDFVFRPLDETDPPTRKEPASIKTMMKGDAAWSTLKRMLGWDVDSTAFTLNLPAHRLTRLCEVLS